MRSVSDTIVFQVEGTKTFTTVSRFWDGSEMRDVAVAAFAISMTLRLHEEQCTLVDVSGLRTETSEHLWPDDQSWSGTPVSERYTMASDGKCRVALAEGPGADN